MKQPNQKSVQNEPLFQRAFLPIKYCLQELIYRVAFHTFHECIAALTVFGLPSAVSVSDISILCLGHVPTATAKVWAVVVPQALVAVTLTLPALVERWLKAGVEQEDGSIAAREKGTPQGGVISPLLANVYLHHAYGFHSFACRKITHFNQCWINIHQVDCTVAHTIGFNHSWRRNNKRYVCGFFP